MLLDDLFRVGDTVRSRFNRQVRRVRRSPIQAGAWLMRVKSVKSVCLTADISPSASYLEKSKVAPSPSNQGCLLLAWFLLRRNTLTPTTLRGPAPNGHPCPDGALAASMRLGPLRIVCVRPAPKSRFASSECYVYENPDQKRINSESTASRLKPVLQSAHIALDVCDCLVGPLRKSGREDAERPELHSHAERGNDHQVGD